MEERTESILFYNAANPLLEIKLAIYSDVIIHKYAASRGDKHSCFWINLDLSV